MYIRYYEFRMRWLDKCQKCPVSGDPLTGNMVNGPKHCFNLNDSKFTKLIYHWEGNQVGKGLS